MSDSAAQEVIRRAIADDGFRQELVSNFDQAVSGLDLTEEEMSALKNIDWSNPLPTDTRVLGTWVHVYKSSATM